MKRVRTVLVVGLLAGGTGCSNLQNSFRLRPASERAVAAGEPAPAPAPPAPPADIFHPAHETPASRLARYFPSLALPSRATSAGTDARKSAPPVGHRNRDLEAVPRPDPADDSSGTATASRSRPLPDEGPNPLPEAGPPRGESRLTSDRRIPSGRPTVSSPPLLSAAVVAETDPSDEPPRPTPAPTGRARPAGRLAQADLPSHRTPATPDASPPRPAFRRRPPSLAQGFEPIRDGATPPPVPPEDRHTRQARAGAEDAAPGQTTTLAMTDESPTRDADAQPTPEPASPSRNLDPPQPEAPAAEAPAASPREAQRAEATEPAAPRTEKADPLPDAPPPIEAPPAARPAPRPDSPQARAAADPDTHGDPTLAGRPRLKQAPAGRREVAGPDLPPAQFPPSYYGPQGTPRRSPNRLAANAPKADPDARPARWIWVPKLFRRPQVDPAVSVTASR